MNIEHTESVIYIVVSLLAAIQLIYLYVVYHAPYRRSIAERKGQTSHTDKQPGISVVIAASDCEELLKEHLPLILEQKYPDFEVIVVDDNSQDETKELLQCLAKKYPHLYSTFTSDSIRYISHKKLALMIAIKAAKKEWIVFTEPNCYPTTDMWLSSMAKHFADPVNVVLGYSNYERKKGFSNLYYMFDTMQQQLRMLGLTLRGYGYMGIGRNMAYRKEVFFNNKGYSRHLNLERGEDDLFINENVPAKQITATADSFSTIRCTSSSIHTWKDDKLSRLFIRGKFHGIKPYILGADTLSRLLFNIVVVGSITLSIICHWWHTLGIVIGLWLMVFGNRIYVFHRASQLFKERRYNVFLPLFDILYPCWEFYFRLVHVFASRQPHMRRKV